MDSSGRFGQRLPLDRSQTEYVAMNPQEPLSFPLGQHRRPSCEFDREISGNISNLFSTSSSTASYYSDEACRWKAVPGTPLTTDVYNLLPAGLDRHTSPLQRHPQRPNLHKCASKSLDLCLNVSGAPPATLSRRQSLDATLDLSTRSNVHNVVKIDETAISFHGDMRQSFINDDTARYDRSCHINYILVFLHAGPIICKTIFVFNF